MVLNSLTWLCLSAFHLLCSWLLRVKNSLCLIKPWALGPKLVSESLATQASHEDSAGLFGVLRTVNSPEKRMNDLFTYRSSDSMFSLMK